MIMLFHLPQMSVGAPGEHSADDLDFAKALGVRSEKKWKGELSCLQNGPPFIGLLTLTSGIGDETKRLEEDGPLLGCPAGS